MPDLTAVEKRALVAQVLTERADDLDATGVRIAVEAGEMVGAGLRVAADHLRSYVKYRLPFQYEDGDADVR